MAAGFAEEPPRDRALDELSVQARACTLCAPHLPLGPKPTFRVSTQARLMIISQAPGTRVHVTGTPFTDASGDRLRSWLGVTRDEFYDVSRLTIMPMGFCYPGRLKQGGDAPPRPECAPLWHERFLALMPQLELILLVGGYAQLRYLGPGNMTSRVRDFRSHPKYFALPHPSWRTIGWEMRNPWFMAEVIPVLRETVARLMNRRLEETS